MKKLAAISLFIFAVFLAGIFAAGLLSYEKNKTNAIAPVNVGFTTSTGEEQASQLSNIQLGQKIILNLAEIAKHNKTSDCWLLINNKVYNVTSYISSHPGGANEIIPYCGQDSTKAYATKGGRGNDHSGDAYNLLVKYYLGDLNQALSGGNVTVTGSKGSVATPTATIKKPATVNSPAIISQNSTTTISSVSLTMAEIVKHNTSANCWLLISNKVYNVTSYINSHPGGSGEIIKYCGQDSTSAYQTKDGRGNNHSQAAYSMLSAYYIGDLNQNISQTQLNTNVQTTNTTPPPPSRGDDEFEDD